MLYKNDFYSTTHVLENMPIFTNMETHTRSAPLSPYYESVKHSIYTWRNNHPDAYRLYQKEYQRKYRQANKNKSANSPIAYILRGKCVGRMGEPATWESREESCRKRFGIDLTALSTFLGYASPKLLQKALNKNKVLNRVVSPSWLRKHHPEFVCHQWKWYNLQTTTAEEACRRGANIDLDNAAVRFSLEKMKEEHDSQ